MQNTLAVLVALAKRPERRATLPELRDDIVAAEADKDSIKLRKIYSFDHIDVFKTGLVAADGDELVITDNGCALLGALGIIPHEQADVDPLQSLNLIDDLIGADAHRNIFEAYARDSGRERVRPDMPRDQAEAGAAPEIQPGGAKSESASHDAGKRVPEPPEYLTSRFGLGLKGPPSRSGFRARFGALLKRGGRSWRNHLQQDQPQGPVVRSRRSGGRIVFALLSLLVFASAAGAVVAFVQAKHARDELAALQRELLPLRERLAKLELLERGKQMADKASGSTRPSAVENRFVEPPLVLTREEAQAVREYIKPAPVPGGSSLPQIAVGDPVTGATLPFPPSVTEKVPKLLGVRFTIRNGAIVIVSKDGRRADAVLGQN